MKKILSFFAAGALALGLIGCSGDLSGDLHDSVVSGLYAEGDFCETDENKNVIRKQFTKISETEQEYSFTYKNSMTQWGGGNGTLNFKIVTKPSAWEKDWGWKKDVNIELPVNDTEWLELEGRGGANNNPGNIVLKDLADGNSYKLILKYDAPAEKVSIKCTGAVTDYPILKAVIVDAINGKELTDALADDNNEVILVRSGTSYSSEPFVPTKDGKIEYYLTNGYLYWGADGEMSTTKPTDDYFVGEWKFDNSHSDWGRKIYVNAVKFDGKKETNLASDIRLHDTSILAESAIVGSAFGWNGSETLTKDDDTVYHYDFTAGAAELIFSIQKIAGSWAARWCGQEPVKNSKGEWDKSKYLSIEANATVNEPTALTPLSYVTAGDPEHAKITSLLKDSKYRLTFKIVGENAVSVELTLLEKVEAKVIDLTGYAARGLFGNFGDISDAIAFKKQSNGTYTLEFEATAEESDCKIANADWKAYPLDGVGGKCQNFTADGKVYNFYAGDSGLSNPKLTGMTVGTTYVMTITPTTDYISVKVSAK